MEAAVPNQRSKRFVSAMRSVARWCVLATVAVLPLVSLNPTILGAGAYPLAVDQAELPRAVLVIVLAGVGLAAWALSEIVDPRGVRWSMEWWALGAFGLLVIVSALRSPYPHLAYVGSWFHWEGLLTLLAYAMWCFLAAQVADGRGAVTFVRAGAVVGAVVAAYGVVQALGVDWATWLDSESGPRRAFSTWNNPDFFGGYLLFPLAFGIVLAAGETEKRWRLVGDASLGLVLFAMVGSITRGAWLVGTVLVVLMLVVLWRKGLIRWRLLLGAGAVTAAALVVVSITSGGAVAERAVSAFSADDGGVAARVEIWQKTAPYALGHALTGAGPDTFEIAFVRLQTSGVPYFANDPHNVLLYLLITVGVAATTSVVWFAGVVVVRASRRAFDACEGFDRLAFVGIWGAALAYAAYLLGSLSIIGTTTLFFVCLGIVAAPYMKRIQVAQPVVVGVAVLALVFAGTGAYLGARGILADNAYLHARIAAREGGERVESAARAVELNPLNPRYQRELSEAEQAESSHD